MLQSDKTALHYKVVANTAHKIEIVSKELASIYSNSFFREDRASLRKEHLRTYIKELEELLKQEV